MGCAGSPGRSATQARCRSGWEPGRAPVSTVEKPARAVLCGAATRPPAIRDADPLLPHAEPAVDLPHLVTSKEGSPDEPWTQTVNVAGTARRCCTYCRGRRCLAGHATVRPPARPRDSRRCAGPQGPAPARRLPAPGRSPPARHERDLRTDPGRAARPTRCEPHRGVLPGRPARLGRLNSDGGARDGPRRPVHHRRGQRHWAGMEKPAGPPVHHHHRGQRPTGPPSGLGRHPTPTAPTRRCWSTPTGRGHDPRTDAARDAPGRLTPGP